MPKQQTIWPRVDSCLVDHLVIISGHGAYYKSNADGANLKIRQGVTVTLWQGLGESMDDGTTGQWLDRGCTVTALSKLGSQNKKVMTYGQGDVLPNLILSSPGKLDIRDNQAGDTQCVMPNFGHAVGTNTQFIMNPAAIDNTQGVQSTSLFHIMQHALTNNLGNNFQWAACTSTITRRAQWFIEKSSVSMIRVAEQLYQMTSQDPAYAAWR